MWIIAVLVSSGCSVPDDPSWRDVNVGIRTLPPLTLLNAKRWAANRNAANFLARISRKTKAFTVRCEQDVFEPAGDQDAISYDIFVDDLMSCLDGSIADVSLAECATRLFKDRGDSFRLNTGLTPDCWIVWAPWIYGMLEVGGQGDKVATKVDEWDPDKVTVDDVERDLVESPVLPRWVPFAVIGGVVVVGGLLSGGAAWLPALCTLQAGSGPACPSSPAYPFGGTPQPKDGAP